MELPLRLLTAMATHKTATAVVVLEVAQARVSIVQGCLVIRLWTAAAVVVCWASMVPR